MNGVILDLETLAPQDLNLDGLRSTLPHWTFHDHTLPEEVPERLRDAEVVITNKVVISASSMVHAHRLKLICVAATGTNNVDLEAASRRGIVVCNVRNYCTASVAQHVFALILALTVRLPQYQSAVAKGRWQRNRQFCILDYPIRELSGLRMGIIGYGTLGQATALLARSLGMEVLVAESVLSKGSMPGRTGMPELLRAADIISLHCPLTPLTHHLIDAAALDAMKADALLINTARGGIVDSAALADALRQGRIGGAGIDVLETEPPPADHPLLTGHIPNLIITPHVAWAATEARQRLVDMMASNIRAFLEGAPKNRVYP